MLLDLFLLTMLTGIVAGLVAGLFGLGGGVLIVPALVAIFTAQHFPESLVFLMAIATSLATIILTSISSVMSHHRRGAVLWKKVYRLVPGVLLGASLGAVVADLVLQDVLKWLFICYLFYVGSVMALQKHSEAGHAEIDHSMDFWAGIGIGLISSLLGIGGGTLTVPYLVRGKVAMKNAVAISSACGLPIAISGTVVYVYTGWNSALLPEWSLGYVYLPALLGITLCSILTAPVGAKLANQLSSKKLKRYFSGVIFLIALKMVFI